MERKLKEDTVENEEIVVVYWPASISTGFVTLEFATLKVMMALRSVEREYKADD